MYNTAKQSVTVKMIIIINGDKDNDNKNIFYSP